MKMSKKRGKKYSLVFALTVNLLILGFFKYYGFLLSVINAILPFNITYRALNLPIGISFYTFQAISYLIDIYRGKVKPQKNIMNFALYITMFPQLIAGPIVRYVDIEEQLRERNNTFAGFGAGARYFITGLSKKVILANSIGALYESISMDFLAGQSLTVIMAWIGAIAYTFQIYFDFSGYSDMAVGLAKMFGFELKKNFDYPYTARNITDFWRRWHISLSTWFREYVYIPLGGNRVSTGRNIFNLLVVWSLTGFWHGASWNFLIWGVYYGVILVLEKFVWGKGLEKLPRIVKHIYTMIIIIIGWVFFFSPKLGNALSYLGVMFGVSSGGVADHAVVYVVISNWLLWILLIMVSTKLMKRIADRIGGRGFGRLWIDAAYIILFVISVSYLITDTFNPFLYFRF